MLPAQHGDSLWIEYGDPRSPRRVLIDGGTPATARVLRQRIEALPPDARRFELLVITHIDADHIGGVVALLADPPPGLAFGDVWFNGWRHLPPDPVGSRGAVQGEALGQLIERGRLPWNNAFGGHAVVVPDAGALPRVDLAGGMRLTLLSPTPADLARLRPYWEREVQAAGLVAGHGATAQAAASHADVAGQASHTGGSRRSHAGAGGDHAGHSREVAVHDVGTLATAAFEQDTAEANGSSIALLVEAEGRRVLLTGDAYPSVLMASLERLFAETGASILPLDALKLSHHGSKGNLSWDFLYRVQCPRFLVSTDGSVFKHPDAESIARVVRFAGRGAAVYFNYRSAETALWDDPARRAEHGYEAHFPADGQAGIRVEL